MARSRFPNDFYIEALRGVRRLGPGQMRRVLASRAAWLNEKGAEWGLAGRNSGYMVDELAAIAQLIELLPPEPPEAGGDAR